MAAPSRLMQRGKRHFANYPNVLEAVSHFEVSSPGLHWEVADAIALDIPLGLSTENNGSQAQLEECSAELAEHGYHWKWRVLRNWRKVADTYPAEKRPPDCEWTLHLESALTGRPQLVKQLQQCLAGNTPKEWSHLDLGSLPEAIRTRGYASQQDVRKIAKAMRQYEDDQAMREARGILGPRTSRSTSRLTRSAVSDFLEAALDADEALDQLVSTTVALGDPGEEQIPLIKKMVAKLENTADILTGCLNGKGITDAALAAFLESESGR